MSEQYRHRTIQAASRIAAAGFPTTCVHTGNLDLMDSTIEIGGTDLHVQVCLHGDFAVGKVLPDGKIRFWDCPTFMDVINRLIQLKATT